MKDIPVKLRMKAVSGHAVEAAADASEPDIKVPGGTLSQITTNDLITQCNVEGRKMQSKHRKWANLVFNCAFAIRQLTDRVGKLEAEKPDTVQ